MRAARHRGNCLPGPRDPFKQDTVDIAPGAIEGAGGDFYLTRSKKKANSNILTSPLLHIGTYTHLLKVNSHSTPLSIRYLCTALGMSWGI